MLSTFKHSYFRVGDIQNLKVKHSNFLSTFNTAPFKIKCLQIFHLYLVDYLQDFQDKLIQSFEQRNRNGLSVTEQPQVSGIGQSQMKAISWFRAMWRQVQTQKDQSFIRMVIFLL